MKTLIIIVVIVIGLIYFLNWKGKTATSNPVTSNSKISYSGADRFTYNILHADTPKDQVEEKGNINYDNFILFFNNFDWNSELRKANTIKVQSSTISIKDELKQQTFAISMSGDPDDSSIGVGYVLLYIFKDSSGIDKVLHIETQDKQEVLNLVKKFFDRDSNFSTAFISK